MAFVKVNNKSTAIRLILLLVAVLAVYAINVFLFITPTIEDIHGATIQNMNQYDSDIVSVVNGLPDNIKMHNIHDNINQFGNRHRNKEKGHNEGITKSLNHTVFRYKYKNRELHHNQMKENNNSDEKQLYIISYSTLPIPSHAIKLRFCSSLRINVQLNININYLTDQYAEFKTAANRLNIGKENIQQFGKLRAMAQYIQYLSNKFSIHEQKSIIIMFVDAYDIVFQRDSNYIIKQFVELNKKDRYKDKVIWSSDPWCSPHGRLWRNICNELEEIGKKYANNSQAFNTLYLNSGGWIGYLYDVIKMFNALNKTVDILHDSLFKIENKFRNDQGFYMYHILNKDARMILDNYGYLWQTMNIENRKELYHLRDKGWYNVKMKNYPSILHFAGHKAKDVMHKFITGIMSKREMNIKVGGSYNITFTSNNNKTTHISYKELCR